MRTEPDLGMLDGWPQGQPVALVVFAPTGSDALLESVRRLAADHPDISNWWLAHPENMIAGPSIDPGFGWNCMLEIKNPSAARGIIRDLVAMPGIDGTIIHAARPTPAGTMRWIRLVQAMLNLLPAPRAAAQHTPDPKWMGGANPTLEQMQRIEELPQHTPIGVLNIHRYKRQATDPYTGETVSGRDLAGRYLLRGFLTFSRLGGRTVWAAGGKGQILGPPTPRWQEFAMISYPGRAAFQHLGKVLASGRAIAYRQEGLEIANVWHTHIFASSRRRDVR